MIKDDLRVLGEQLYHIWKKNGALAKQRGALVLAAIDSNDNFIVCEGFNTPPLGAIKKVLNPEANTLPKQHTPLLGLNLTHKKAK